MNNNEKERKFDIPKMVGFYDMKDTKGLNSPRMKNALKLLPKTVPKILIPPLPEIENKENSFEKICDNDLKWQEIEKIINPSNRNDIHTGLEILLGSKLF